MRFELPSSFPDSATTGYGMPMGNAGGVATLVGPPLTAVERFENPVIEAEETAIIPAYVDEISVILPLTGEGNSVNALKSLAVGSTQYSPGSRGALEPGEYSYDRATQALTIQPATNATPVVGTAIKYIALQKKDAVGTDRYKGAIPPFFTDWKVSGSAVFSRWFGQSPSGSLTFEMDADEWASRQCDLTEGTLILFRGHYYGSGNVTTSVNPHDNIAVVSVQLQGSQDHLLREQFQLKRRTAGLIPNLSGGNTSDKSVTSVTVSDILSRGGVDYAGPTVSIKLAADRDLRDSIQGTGLFAYARSAEAFTYLDSDRVEFRTWNTGRTIHNVSSSELLNGFDGSFTPIQYSYNQSGNKDGSDILAAEYKNTRLDLDESEGDESGEGGRTNVKRVMRSGTAYKRTANGGIVLFTPPSGVDRSQHSAFFDNGGPTKDYLVETYENGQLTKSTYQKYGYVGKTSDYATWVASGTVSTPTFIAPELQPRTQGWQEVESRSMEVERDGDGYPTRQTTTITTLRRYKQESDRRETLFLFASANYTESSDATIQANMRAAYNAALGLYDTFQVTEEEVIDYVYGEPLRKHYPDLPELEEGEPEDRYVRTQTTTRRYYYESDDLEAISTDDDGNPIVARGTFFAGGSTDFQLDVDGLTIKTGEDFERVVENEIVYPPAGVSKANYDSTQDLYIRKETLKRATGSGLRNVFEEPPRVEEIDGKVPGAQRLEKFDDGNTPTIEEEDDDQSVTLLNTPNNGLDPQTDPINGSVSFSGAYTKAAALAAAKVDISIQNTQGVEVRSGLLLPATREYDVGDVMILDGVRFIILSVEEELAIEQSGSYSLPYQVLSIGRYVAPNVDDTEVD